MQYAISVLPVVPLRAGPSDKEEMISQVLFGELVIIHEQQNKWSFVEIVDDGYKGWLFSTMLTNITEELANEVSGLPAKISGNLFMPVINTQGNHSQFIPAGSKIYSYKPASNSFKVGDLNFNCKQEPLFYSPENAREEISSAALAFINIPYLWGGKNPFGIDCSGLTQTLLKLFGIQIPRDSRQQVAEGSAVNFISEARPGDLAFFDNEEGEIIHTGIIVNNQKIIHASGHVRIDSIDHQGIYNREQKQYSHRLRVIKNVVDNRVGQNT